VIQNGDLKKEINGEKKQIVMQNFEVNVLNNLKNVSKMETKPRQRSFQNKGKNMRSK